MEVQKPQAVLLIPLRMKNILDYLVKNKSLEWSAWGRIIKVDEELKPTFKLVDIDFPKQTNYSSITEIEGDDLIDLTATKPKEERNEWKLWIHSHHTMGAFWSCTDRTQMESFGSTSYMMSLVVSTTGYKAAFNLFNPLRADFDMEIIIEDLIIDESELKVYNGRLEAAEVTKTSDYTKGRTVFPHGTYLMDKDDYSSWDEYMGIRSSENATHSMTEIEHDEGYNSLYVAPNWMSPSEQEDYFSLIHSGHEPDEAEYWVRRWGKNEYALNKPHKGNSKKKK